jgi:hypothetical protein
MDAKFLDSLYEGDSPNGARLGMGLTGGDFWPRVVGCSLLYRGPSMVLIDFTNILAVTDAEASEISPPGYVPHNGGSTYFYVIRRVNNCGYEEQTLAAAVKVSIDAGGELVLPQPNNIFEVRAAQVDGNKVQLVWYYCPIGQQLPPIHFNIYYDSGTGQIDYGNAIAVIGYAGRRFYSYVTNALDVGIFLFAIRAIDRAGRGSASAASIRVELRTESSAEITILSAKAI